MSAAGVMLLVEVLLKSWLTSSVCFGVTTFVPYLCFGLQHRLSNSSRIRAATINAILQETTTMTLVGIRLVLMVFFA
jgi:hypothetical protein